MESSSGSEEPYIDSFFLPDGILDSEDDDVNAPLHRTTMDGGVAGGSAVVGGGSSSGDTDVLSPVAELMPSFLGIDKVSWTAPPLLIPSQTADEIVVFYHDAPPTTDDFDSTHPPSLKASPALFVPAPQQEEDFCSDEFRDCLSHEKSPEPTSSLRVTSSVFTPFAAKISSGRAVSASPPPGFDSSERSSGSPHTHPGSPKEIGLPTKARSGTGSGAVAGVSGRQRPAVAQKSPSNSSHPTPQRREATRGSNRKQSYASVVVAEPKKAGVRDGMARQQNLPNGTIASDPASSVAAPAYATPPRTNVAGSIRSVDRRHRSFAPSAAALSSAAGGIERSQSADRTGPTGADSSTPSRAAKQRNHRRQRKPKASAPHDPPIKDGCGELELSGSLHLQPHQPINNDSSTSSSSLTASVADSSSSSSSHADVDESESKDDRCVLLSNGQGELSEDSHRAEPMPVTGRLATISAGGESALSSCNKETKRPLLRFNAISVSKVAAPFVLTWEVVLPLLFGCFSFVGFIFAEAAKVLILLALGVAATCRYAADEVQYGGAGAAGSYAAFLLLPACCDLVMASFSLPHFTPHFVSTVAICQLCQQSRPRKLFSAASTRFLVADDPLADDVSHFVLRLARYALLVAELYEGFSRSNMSYMVAGVPARALLAYVVSLARSNLLLSPVGWASASVQLLLTSHVGCGRGGGIGSVVATAALVLLGMASVQLSRRVQPLEADGGGDNNNRHRPAHRRSAPGDEARHGVRSGPGKRPSVRP
jgi:hypothetical protein